MVLKGYGSTLYPFDSSTGIFGDGNRYYRHSPQDASERESTFSKPSAELLDNGKNRSFKGYGIILYICDLTSGDSLGG